MAGVYEGGGFRAVNHNHPSTEVNLDAVQSPNTTHDVTPARESDDSLVLPTTTLTQTIDQNMATVATAHPPPSAPPVQAASEQPQATSLSTSAAPNNSDKEATVVGPSPYGTRSRNRPGTSRINYAEDVEMDFELAQPPPKASSNKSTVTSARASKSPPDDDASNKTATAHTSAWSSTQKDSSIPGTSTFSANPNSTATHAPPRKRKAAGAATAANGNVTNNTTSLQQTTRRATTALSHQGARETNMYTFEKSKAILKNGRLEADDGTVFAVDGRAFSSADSYANANICMFQWY